MPFSKTETCSAKQWTNIFERLFKSAIEHAGLDYVCRRAVATRGNIVGQIVEDLDDADVVLADLTDRNANVFYELGVRHAFQKPTIMLAQRRADIPFDLRSYAVRTYKWRDQAGRERFTRSIRLVLDDIERNPRVRDNPVMDFYDRCLRDPSEIWSRGQTRA